LKRAVPSVVVGMAVFVAIAEWLLFLMPKPHGRLTYMVAGTASTVAALGAIFAHLVRRRELWGVGRPAKTRADRPPVPVSHPVFCEEDVIANPCDAAAATEAPLEPTR